jgi:hypothetical protein
LPLPCSIHQSSKGSRNFTSCFNASRRMMQASSGSGDPSWLKRSGAESRLPAKSTSNALKCKSYTIVRKLIYATLYDLHNQLSTMLLNHTPRASLRIASSCTQQVRHASLMRRPKRPYTFTQLVTLSDGSTFVQRTTSPQPVYRSTKDVRNNPLWNPSSQKLLNVEEDEAGRLKRFRGRFGRGWDAEAVTGAEEVCSCSASNLRWAVC